MQLDFNLISSSEYLAETGITGLDANELQRSMMYDQKARERPSMMNFIFFQEGKVTNSAI